MSPKYVADCIVDGMLSNRQNISVPSSINLLTIVKYVSLIFDMNFDSLGLKVLLLPNRNSAISKNL